MAVGDFYRVTIVGELHGQLIETVLHYRESVSAGAGGASVLATEMDLAFAAEVLPILSGEFTYEQTPVQKFKPAPPEMAVAVNTGSGNGGVAESSLPSSSCAVVKKRTTLAGRKYRGRIFQAGIPITMESDSAITGGYAASLQAAWVDTFTTVSSGGYTFVPVLWHKASNTTTDVQSLLATLPLRVQRRRELGRGA